MACTAVPLLSRLFYGLLSREGLRVSEALGLAWSDVDLENGVLVLDENKTDEPRSWALDPHVVEALKTWKRILGKRATGKRAVLLGADGEKIDPYEAARLLRRYLKIAGVKRDQLFESTATRMALRAHDLRGGFVTVSLANGKTEAWVADRTGHTTSAMIYTYKRAARTHRELHLGTFAPLHEAIPELRDLHEPNP